MLQNTQKIKKFHLIRYPNNQNPEPILKPRKEINWEASAVFNPTVIKDGDVYHMLYRTCTSEMEKSEARLTRPGYFYKNRQSYIGYAESKDGINFARRDIPFISPDIECDMYGCEDPRVTKLGDTFYITYTAIDAPLDNKEKIPNIRIALATTKDFITVQKHGIIGPSTQSKAAAIFPELINNKVAMVLTVAPDSTNSHVSIRYFDSLEQILQNSEIGWKDFLKNSMDTALLKTEWWLHRGPELGAVPIKSEKGWLFIYSAESMSSSWTVSAALSEINNPHKLISRTPGYLLQSVTEYERNGVVENVTFSSGAVVIDKDLYVYYGAADKVIGLATCKLDELLDYLELFKDKK